MLLGAGLEQLWHHCRAHRFFAAARWSAGAVGLVLADLIMARLLPAGAPIIVAAGRHAVQTAGEDGVRRGLAPRDGAAKGPKPIGFAHLLGDRRDCGATPVSGPPGLPAGAGVWPHRDHLTWATFLRSQAHALLAADFVEATTLTGTRLHVLAILEHASRASASSAPPST